MNNYTVYCHTNRINGKRYVGITSTSVERRWKNGLGYTMNPHFYNAIQKYGWEEFSHEILFTHLSKDEACKKEIELIDKWNLTDERYGYNNTLGGEHGLMSEHTKRRMSDAQKGENGFWYGKHLSESTKHKMSLRKQGRLPQCATPKPCVHIETGKCYKSLQEASDDTGWSIAAIHKSCNHGHRRKVNYHFEYL